MFEDLPKRLIFSLLHLQPWRILYYYSILFALMLWEIKTQNQVLTDLHTTKFDFEPFSLYHEKKKERSKLGDDILWVGIQHATVLLAIAGVPLIRKSSNLLICSFYPSMCSDLWGFPFSFFLQLITLSRVRNIDKHVVKSNVSVAFVSMTIMFNSWWNKKNSVGIVFRACHQITFPFLQVV